MRNISKIILTVLLLGLLAIIRGFEDNIFYDPLLSFFKSDYINKELPEVDFIKLMLNIAGRFFLNTIVSLLILWVLFKKLDVIKLSVIIYIILFFILLIMFWVLFYSSGTNQYMGLFYVRRFLIQPILLLILIPAFYFMKNK